MIYGIITFYPLHQSIISHIKLIISDSTSTVSLSSHPDYQSYNPHCIYDNTGTICMTSYEYIWHHIHSSRYDTTLCHSHTVYSCHHTQDTCHCIHCSWAITYSVLIIPHLQYVWYQTHYMYDIMWILCDITTTLYDITRLYSWHHIQYTCHRIHCSWAITYSVLIIAHLQHVWYQTHYMYDIIWILCDITTSLYDIARLYSWHHFHTIHDITPTVYDMIYTLLVTSQPR